MYFNEPLVKEEATTTKQVSIPVEAHLFDEAVHLTGLTEYGVSWEELTTGQALLPAQGARFDIAFEGTFEGPKLNGTISGVDYLTVRADGRFQLNLQAVLTTDDGEKIAVYEDGILIPPQDDSMIAQIRLNLEFNASSPKYAWMNQIQGWGRGAVDWNTGQVEVQVYAA